MHIERFENSTYKANAFVAHDRKDAIVVDVPAHTAKDIFEYMKKKNLVLKCIVLTHTHLDHIEDLEKLKKHTNAKVYAHNFDYHNQYEINSIFESAEEIKVDAAVSDGDVIEAGTMKFTVIHTPGHTPGSICLYSEKENILFSGDTLFKDAYGRVDLPHGDEEKMRESLRTLAKLPGKTTVYPGHGSITEIGKEKWLKNI
ncbi:MBL fold metallo-hydrolase [archaeon]|nr:MBL fold metallo-hydrolase [archaeon]